MLFAPQFYFSMLAFLTLLIVPGCTPAPPIEVAELVRTQFVLQKDEVRKIYWLPVPADLTVIYQTSKEVSVSAVPRPGAGSPRSVEIERPGIAGIRLSRSPGVQFITLERALAPPTPAPLILEVGIALDEVTGIEALDALAGDSVTIMSPLIEYPSGEPSFQLPDGVDHASFDQFAREEFGVSVDSEIPFLDYVMFQELLAAGCPLPPAGAAGDFPSRVPAGASHNDNHCGMSAFIHSMKQTFPGALPPHVTTDPARWDELGDNLDHSNTFGIRGGKFVERVNFKFGWEGVAQDGKRYCAVELDDPSAQEVANCAAKCNVKILIYDLPTYGHWIDVVAVNGNRITIQDYADSYDVTYDADEGTLDFSSGTGTGPSIRNFDADDRIAGDDIGEIVNFYAVCECEREGATRLSIPDKGLSFEQRTRNPMRPPRRH